MMQIHMATQENMAKHTAIWVLRIGDYRPDICEHTIPTIKNYAQRINAEYREITERKYPDKPITYEKLQIYELGKYYAVNILIDADIMISDHLLDVPNMLKPYQVISLQAYSVPRYFPYDTMFTRLPLQETNDGKTVIGPSANFLATSNIGNWGSHEIWNPDGVHVPELNDPLRVDEYVLAHNLAKYKYELSTLGNPDHPDIYHAAVSSIKSDHDLDKLIEHKRFWETTGKLGQEKRAIFTLNINNFQPEITKNTLPKMEEYAKYCGADFHIITDRKYPDWPIPYEKFQIWELGREYDKILFLDADTLIYQGFPNVFKTCPHDHVMLKDGFNLLEIYKANPYFLRASHNQGIAANFILTTRYTHDIWHPLACSVDEAWGMVRAKYARKEYVLDEFALSYNLCKYNIPFVSCPTTDKFVHIGCQKMKKMEALTGSWDITRS